MPRLPVARLAINPPHDYLAAAHDYLFRLETRVGIAREPSPPILGHGRLSLDPPSVRRGRGVLEYRVVGQKRCQPVSVVSIECLVDLSTVGRAACSADPAFCAAPRGDVS